MKPLSERLKGSTFEIEEDYEDALPDGTPRLDIFAYTARGSGACVASTYEVEAAALILRTFKEAYA